MRGCKKIELEDREWIEPLLKKADKRALEYSFTFTYTWQHVFNYRACKYNDYLIIKSERPNYPPSYLFPTGSGDIKEVIEKLHEEAKHNGHALLFHSTTAEDKAMLEEIYPGRFDFLPLTDFYDYVYETESLVNLTGKKLSSKRNHINRFIENNPDWTYEPVTEANLDEVRQMSQKWLKLHYDESDLTLNQEAQSVRIAIDNFSELRLEGGAIRAGGNIVAFSLGDRLNSDTYLIQIEKAFSDIQGAYAIINREFARHNCTGFKYINREDDSGNEGLRKAKKSYRPVFMVEKYAARFKD